MQVNRPHPLLFSALVFALFCSGCGSSNNLNSLTPAQAQAVSQQLSQATMAALSSQFGSTPLVTERSRPTLPEILANIHSDQSPGCVSTSAGENCDWQLAYSGPCSDGGTISVAGNINGILDNNGGGSIATQIVVTPSNCNVGSLTFNGDPDVAIDSQMSFANSTIAFPATFSKSGGISFGPNPSGSCQLNVKYTASSLTSCTISGNICGQSVSGSC